MSLPVINIWITTYNHENFIAKAIDSVLEQKTIFPYQLIIGEDCSTDRTREIVLAYKDKYPDIIRLYLADKNLGMKAMFQATYKLCTGDYIAWLDGDDYWSDPMKLQKQVEFLEANSDFVLCFHNIRFFNYNLNNAYDHIGPVSIGNNMVLDIEQLSHFENQIYSLSVVYRNVLGESLPRWFYTLPYLDWGFYFILIKHGKFKYLDEVMGVYRLHSGGAYNGQEKRVQFCSIISLFKILKSNLDYIPKKQVNQTIGYYYYVLLKLDLELNNFKSGFKNLKNVIAHDMKVFQNNRTELLRILYYKLKRSFKHFLALKTLTNLFK